MARKISVAECCQKSGFSDPMVRKLIREGKLTAVKYESCDRVFVDEASLDAYLATAQSWRAARQNTATSR
jgi:hypothetical protein